jgi:hypothetical protein
MPRINARIDEATQAQLDYLTEVTGASVSHVVRDSVARYHAEVQSRSTGPRRLLSLVGQGDSGRSDIATNVKSVVGEALDAKWPVAHGCG